mgnify:CR=1 FL=1
MPRPNLAQDKPPVELSIGGHSYSINTDYRVWIGVLHDLRNIYPAPKNAEQAYHNAEIFAKIEEAVFGKIIKEKLENQARYNTVYSKVDGSAAAPTAGLHFTDELLKKLKEKGFIGYSEIIDCDLLHKRNKSGKCTADGNTDSSPLSRSRSFLGAR